MIQFKLVSMPTHSSHILKEHPYSFDHVSSLSNIFLHTFLEIYTLNVVQFAIVSQIHFYVCALIYLSDIRSDLHSLEMYGIILRL
jgi:hypothetical protein